MASQTERIVLVTVTNDRFYTVLTLDGFACPNSSVADDEIDVTITKAVQLMSEFDAAVLRRLARRAIDLPLAEATRYNARTAVERVFGRLKDQAGGSTVRVRGPTKVMCHLMFGILVVTVDQLVRLVA